MIGVEGGEVGYDEKRITSMTAKLFSLYMLQYTDGFRVPAATPGDNFILDVNVDEIEQGFNIEFEPAHCGYDFPLMSMSGADINTGSTESGSDWVTYSSSQWDQSASVTVESVQRATPPVFGTFTLAQEGGGVVKGMLMQLSYIYRSSYSY